MASAKVQNNSHLHSLTAQSRGKWVMAQSDPNNRDPIRRAKIEALVGKGNVIVLPDSEFLKISSNPDLLKKYTNEGIDPLVITNDVYEVGSATILGGDLTQVPPSNITVVKETKGSLNGQAITNVDISFYGVSGILDPADYEVAYIPVTNSLLFSVPNFTATAGSHGIINISFDTLPDANNYVVSAFTYPAGGLKLEKLLQPTYGTTNYSDQIGPLAAGQYSVYVKPYNDTGLAGTASATIRVTVV
jgi:hypothetical protein